MIIGWREWIKFPDFEGIFVKAKVDTGAQTSAIHALNINTKTQGSIDIATFEIHPFQGDRKTTLEVSAPIVDRRNVKSSTGHQQKRLVISTNIELADRIWPIEITLTNRNDMGFHMLLGRQAINKQFIVDPARSFLAGNIS